MLNEAEEAFDRFEYEPCISACEQALGQSSTDTEQVPLLYHLLCSSLLELGRIDLAEARLQEMLTLPSLPSNLATSACYSLAQIKGGMDGCSLYLRGISFCGGSAEDQTLKANGYASLAELYMTDLCEEPDAEQKCTEYSNLAIASDRDNCEALRISAELALIHDNIELAKEYVLAIKTESLNIEIKIAVSKILIECQCLTEAIDLLGSVVEESEDEIYAWYLLVIALKDSGDIEDAAETASQALGIIEQNIKKGNNIPVDNDVLDQLKALADDQPTNLE